MDEKESSLSKLSSNVFTLPGLTNLLQMSSSVDGFKRENAVRRLGMIGNPASIPYLIIRANDWVPQVRTAAYEALARMLRTGNGDAFVAALPQILHLQTCRRADHSELMQAVQDFLLRKENRSVLLGGLEHPDARVARIIARLLVDHELISPSELLAKGLKHNDAIVHSIVIDVLRKATSDCFEELAVRALRDTYMPVRREALQQLLQRSPARGLVAAQELLFDRSASVREIATRYLISVGEHIEPIYARVLRMNPLRATLITCVLWGWGFLNREDRIGAVEDFLDSPLSSVRRQALLTLVKLSSTAAAPRLARALADASPSVCNEAARLIVRHALAPEIEALITIARSAEQAHVAYACGRVAREGNKWDWLRFVLTIYGQPGRKLSAETLSREIDAWQLRFNRSAAQPDARQLNEIARALMDCRTKLSTDRIRLLEFTLRSYGAVL